MSLFGGFEARLPSGSAVAFPTKKAQALLAYLAFRPGQAHQRPRLAALLWGDTGEEQARSSLRQTLLVLRRALAGVKPAVLLIDTRTVALNPAAARVDVVEFEQALASGGSEAMERAVSLYRADLLDGFDLKESAASTSSRNAAVTVHAVHGASDRTLGGAR